MSKNNNGETKHFSRSPLGFAITLDNGWCIDASFGAGNYAENRHKYTYTTMPEEMESCDCETIIQDGNGVDRTFEIAQSLNIRVDGKNESAVIPNLKIRDWLRIVNYVNEITLVRNLSGKRVQYGE
jgi:hypothetical protein